MSRVRDYFDLAGEPFAADIVKAQLFKYVQLDQLFEVLSATTDAGSMALVTGRAGTGKTTSVRTFMQGLSARYKVIYLGQFQRGTALFCQLGLEFGIRKNLVGPKRMVSLCESVTAESKMGRRIVIVVDEAHLLDKPTFEDLRLLSNAGAEPRAPLSMILLGQHWLRHTLKRQEHEALYQRLRHRYALEGLSFADTKEYIWHHLKLVGCKQMPFTDAAVSLIFIDSDGIFREINNLAYGAMLHAAISDQRTIDEYMVKAVIDQRDMA